MRKSAVLFCAVLLLSCHGNHEIHVPAGIITPDSLVPVLTDIHIFQANAQLGYLPNDSNSTKAAFMDILKKHSLTMEEYNKSMQYYSYHPAILDSVYEKVLNNIAQQKAELLGKKHS